MKSFSRTAKLFFRYAQIVAGKSYYHRPLRLGGVFRPGELAGYFNDLTVKTEWGGEVDEQGIPLIVLLDGRKLHFATTIVQKALGHWDQWLLTQDDEDKNTFLHLCSWLVARQDGQGGWDVGALLGLSLPSPYSAMVQGQCISAFVRAWRVSEDHKFAEGAWHAFELLRTPVSDGGPMIIQGNDVFLEEYVSIPRSSILNGWIYALFGLYDYWLAFGDSEAWNLYQRSLYTLKNSLHQYDTGYWSYYDVCGHVASGFYHDLHIHQLTALVMVDNDPLLARQRDRWMEYQQGLGNRARAFLVKAVQKLREPGVSMNVK